MIKTIGLILGVAGLLVFLKSATFGDFLAGGSNVFGNFTTAISGSITPEISFLILCVIVVIAVMIATIWI